MLTLFSLQAGISTDRLSLALEPEAASLFCKYVPTEKVTGARGASISCFSPGKKYLVLDAGGTLTLYHLHLV